jgi:outer membrane protein OmpA-like peptidoglycan-associated protein
MSLQPVQQHQQSEIFFIFFLILVVAVIILQDEIRSAMIDEPHEQPPIITLPEASGYRFKSGSAELDSGFVHKLTSGIVPDLEKIADRYAVDIIEVIGHTDGQVVATQNGNLDTVMETAAGGDDIALIQKLEASSNADLGLMRAVAVVTFLRNQQASGRLQGIGFHAYSAAQLLLPDGRYAPIDRSPDATRRRIELRFTRSKR